VIIRFTPDNRRMVISFPYDPTLLDIVQRLPDGRKYDKVSKFWTAPVTRDNLRHLVNAQVADEAIDARLAEMDKPLATPEPATEGQVFKTQPYAHQAAGFQLAKVNPRIALWWEQGTGKTWVAANVLQHRIRSGEVRRALVIAPKTVLTSWAVELRKHTDLPFVTVAGKHRDDLVRFAPPGTVCLINYELLIPMAKVLTGIAWDCVVLDESYYIKSVSAQRTKIAWAVCAKAGYRMLLCGSPVSQGPEDLFAQYKALDDGETFGTSFYSFRAKFFRNEGRFYPDWKVAPGAMDELKRRMFSRGHRVIKAECFDLPPKVYQTLEVEMEPEQARIYRQMERDLVAEWEGGELTAQNAAVAMIRLNQITSGFAKGDDGKVLELKHRKMDALADILRDKSKAVVWCLFRHDVSAIAEKFAGMNPVVISGDVALADRASAIDRFQTDPTCRLFVGQIRAGGIGITLTAAQDVVYYSQGYSLIDRAQSEDRTHRIGTVGTVTYVDLVCPGTVDEDILTIIATKRGVADQLTGDISVTILQKLKASLTGGKTAHEDKRRSA
jgi:SNF2 family DNA or RNA helicase